jgi:hypothetical protein
VGRVNSKTAAMSIAHMQSPAGSVEPGQTPEFEEYTVVLKGALRVTHTDGALDVAAGFLAHSGPPRFLGSDLPGNPLVQLEHRQAIPACADQTSGSLRKSK